MSSPNADSADFTAIADRYRRLAARFSLLVEAVPSDRWDALSPCEGWTARDVVDHVVSTQADLLRRMSFPTPSDFDDASWPAVRGSVQAALDDPERAGHGYAGYFGPTTFGATVDTFYSSDLVVHTWDLARATAMSAYLPIDPTEMALIESGYGPLGDNVRMPGILGPALDVGPEADAQTAFLAFLGRRA